ncbi:MAG: NAD-dependent epimerase/dehydratase family protein [Proteobacteria bacterium]|nr:MAG: NAD-dependent epimerase/dehydratase family protein [Pseudomonadota bacterium]
MTNVLVFGKTGQLASELFERKNASFTFLSKDEFEPGNEHALEKRISIIRPTVIVNCAAYTAVDKAEADEAAAYELNSTFVSTLAKLSAKVDAHLVHFSTDYVFDGLSNSPYVEDQPTGPRSVYGKSKLLGEQAVFANAKSATIFRTSWVYSKYGANFVKTMIRLANADKPLRVVADQFGTPTSAGFI